MNMTYSTHIKAIHPKTGKEMIFAGPLIQAICWSAAEQWCEDNMPYAYINGMVDSVEENGVKTQFVFWN